MEKVLSVQDLQCTWLLLFVLLQCSSQLHTQSRPPGAHCPFCSGSSSRTVAGGTRTWNLASPAMGGNAEPQNLSMAFSWRAPLQQSRRCSDRKTVRWRVSLTCASQHSSLFRVLLLRRLWLPLPPSSHFCRCGRPLDPCGHHREACAQAGVLGRRGYALESAAARVCREAGARVSTNVLVRDLDLLPLQHADAQRLEVVADGLPLFHGAQIASNGTGLPTVVAHGRQMVCRGASVPLSTRAREVSSGTSHTPRQREICMDLEVEHDFGLCQCSCFRAISLGRSYRPWL